jgi:hypothetical protein
LTDAGKRSCAPLAKLNEIGFTAHFCLEMSFTAYAQLRLPRVAEVFTHFGFPDYFRVELSWAMLSPLSREACVGMLFTKATHCEELARVRQAPRMTTLFARIAHGLQERGHVGHVVGVARRRVAGEAGFDVTLR